ncbi:MAG TPA: DUF5916 domain-containing protein [Chitinophagaceae bacterium]|nr:DUF5916 domain-containing protein [Chitinophagaceae bacterium]
MRSLLLFAIAILSFSTLFFAQTPQKQLAAVKTTLPIKLDGNIHEEAWKSAVPVTDLVEMRPSFGKKEGIGSKSELYLLYDDNAVYFGGNLYETTRDSIATQLVGRDEVGTNDFIGIIFDTYQDKINGLGFYVTPLNEQFDVKYSIGSNGGEDMSWNTVYHTATSITDKGWSFEMEIPYSALRFSKEKMQDWNIQILRRRAKTGQQYSWSPVDPTRFGFMNQAGVWTGLQNIQPPLRLSFSPYFSTYLTCNPVTTNTWKTSVNGGMDVKYGITDGFTMDMTLIPDFGQVQSDNQVLNLSPFEVKFSENRSFFNEGIELFNKGNLFYSRRIGGQPLHYSNSYDLQPGEKIIENPVQTRLINATKISGRTRKKLGIGIFNAITKAQYATIENSNKEEYKIQTDPLTNYNILVLDQGLKNNSRVTFINTNTWRSGKDYDANVSSVDWDLYDNNVDWNVWGQVAHSRLMDYEAPGKTRAGNMYMVFLGKFKGRFNFDIHRWFADDKYDPSDMGYFTNNNYVTHGFYASYKWVKPKSFYNNIYLNFNGNYSQRYRPRQYQDFRVNANINSQLKNLWYINVNGDIRPERNDFYEARLDGRVVKQPGSWMKGMGISTNSAKKYSASVQVYHRVSAKYNASNLEMNVSNNYRFNNKLSVGLGHFFEFHNRNFGFAAISDNADSVFMSLRKIRTVENVLNIKYSFSNKMGLTLRVRHYWSKVKYYDFMNLEADGTVEKLTSVNQNPDINVNLFNIDMNYTWQFAPGSFINLTWKISSELHNQLVMQRYYRNLGKSIDTPSFNSLSLKVIYFLDWLSVKNKNKKIS